MSGIDIAMRGSSLMRACVLEAYPADKTRCVGKADEPIEDDRTSICHIQVRKAAV